MATTTTTAEKKIAWAESHVAAGRTVYFATALRVTVFTPASVAKLRAAGVAPWKIGADGALLIREGRTRYVVADYCKLAAS